MYIPLVASTLNSLDAKGCGLDWMECKSCRRCGAFNIPQVMPSIDHIPDEYKQICNACCQLQVEEQPTIQGVIQILHNLD